MSPNAPRRRLPRFRATCRKTIKWGGLVLALLLAGVWVRSEFVVDAYFAEEWQVRAGRGAAGFGWTPLGDFGLGYQSVPIPSGYRRYWWWSYQTGSWGRGLQLPIWMPLSLTLIATAAAWRLDVLARRRERVGFCPKCGYDRAGLGGAAVCPECGTPPVKA